MLTERAFRLPRRWSNQMLRSVAPLCHGEVINVSGWDDRDKEGGRYRNYFHNATGYFISNHRGERGTAQSDRTDFEIDLAAPLANELVRRFDVVFNHTTLEHVFEVHTAFTNLCEMTRDGLIVIVPFAQELHWTRSYGNFWRFTPMGLRELFSRNGLEVVFESATPFWRSGIYLFFMGSRVPQTWRAALPPYWPIGGLGESIARGTVMRAVDSVRGWLRKTVDARDIGA